jgi:hypothetical protein
MTRKMATLDRDRLLNICGKRNKTIADTREAIRLLMKSFEGRRYLIDVTKHLEPSECKQTSNLLQLVAS